MRRVLHPRRSPAVRLAAIAAFLIVAPAAALADGVSVMASTCRVVAGSAARAGTNDYVMYPTAASTKLFCEIRPQGSFDHDHMKATLWDHIADDIIFKLYRKPITGGSDLKLCEWAPDVDQASWYTGTSATCTYHGNFDTHSYVYWLEVEFGDADTYNEQALISVSILD